MRFFKSLINSPITKQKLLLLAFSLCLQAHLVFLILDRFIKTSVDQFQNHFNIYLFLRIILTLLFSVNSFQICKGLALKKAKSPFHNVSFLIFTCTPFVDAVFFLNFELEPNFALFMCVSRLTIFFALSLMILEVLHRKIVFFVSSSLVFVNSAVQLLKFIGFSAFLQFSLSLLIICLILVILSNFFAKKDNIVIPIKNQWEYIKKVLEISSEGILVLKEFESDYTVEFSNNRLIRLLKLSATPSFREIDNAIRGFCFQKVKLKQGEEKSAVFIQIDGVEEEEEKRKPFGSLRELIKFYRNFSKCQNLTISFCKNQKKFNDSRLKLNLKREVIDNDCYYYITILAIEKILSLREKSDSKNRLLSAFTHELKTPLNGSLPPLEEARIHSNSLACVYVDQAMASLKILENSLNNIIDYSLILSEQLIIHLSNVNIEQVLNEIFLIVKLQVEVKKLNLTIEIDKELLKTTILTDYNRLKQLILNALLNSIQFTLRGSINVSVHLIQKNLIEFRIEDSGVGIPPEKLETLKIKLKEEDNTQLQLNTTGFCLGLIVSQKIALLLGNDDLKIHSLSMVGTTVSFVIRDQNIPSLNDENMLTVKDQRILNKSMLLHRIRTSNLFHQKKIKSFQEQSITRLAFEDKKQFSLSESVINIEILTRKTRKKGDKDYKNLTSNPSIDLDNLRTINKVPNLDSEGEQKYRSTTKATKKLEIICVEEEEDQHDDICRCEEILIVDDDAFNLLSLEMILKGFHFSCMKALNGLQALSCLKEKKKCRASNCKGAFLLIFMDYQMPDMDGVETTGNMMRMMENKEIEETPIIGCTAFTAKDEVEHCLNAGMKDVLFKPVNKTMIGDILKEWI